MNKQDLIKAIRENCDVKVTKEHTGAIIDSLSKVIRDEVKNGGDVSIPHVGTFKPKDRDAYTGRNPSTGESVDVPAKRNVKFKPNVSFISELNQKS